MLESLLQVAGAFQRLALQWATPSPSATEKADQKWHSPQDAAGTLSLGDFNFSEKK